MRNEPALERRFRAPRPRRAELWRRTPPLALVTMALLSAACSTRDYNASAKGSTDRPTCSSPVDAPSYALTFDTPRDDALPVLVIGDPGSGGAHQRIVSDATYSTCFRFEKDSSGTVREGK